MSVPEMLTAGVHRDRGIVRRGRGGDRYRRGARRYLPRRVLESMESESTLTIDSRFRFQRRESVESRIDVWNRPIPIYLYIYVCPLPR